jgi:hypothetical protein
MPLTEKQRIKAVRTRLGKIKGRLFYAIGVCESINLILYDIEQESENK